MQALQELSQQQATAYSDFWQWFAAHQQRFFAAVKEHERIEADFFDELSLRLDLVNEGFYFLAGMADDHTAELIITVDGDLKNIVFAEELVAAAPTLPGWNFLALKPATTITEGFNLSMAERKFSTDNISFYPTTDPAYPDEIDLTFVYADWQEDDAEAIQTGVFLFLDNYLGELSLATEIDSTTVAGAADADLIPLAKLKEYLHWRQLEFVEKYEGLRHDTANDAYGGFEAELENGNPLLAIFNTDLLGWDSTPSHPWIARFDFGYGDETTGHGMPDEAAYALLNELEELIVQELPDAAGYLNIGRETGNGVRHLYLACRDFRQPAKVGHYLQQAYAQQFTVSVDIYKDKYWQTFERFRRV